MTRGRINMRMKRGAKAALGKKLESIHQGLSVLVTMLESRRIYDVGISCLVELLLNQVQESVELLNGQAPGTVRQKLL